jgi:hypothetical protein
VPVLIVALLILVPGSGAALAAWRPREIALPTRVAMAGGLGVAVVGGIAFFLAAIRAFDTVTFVSGVATATAVLWAVALRRHGPEDRWSEIRREVAADRWPIVAGLAVLAAFAAVRLLYSPLVHLWDATAWRYWADGVEIAFAGRIPRTALQYGELTPTIVNKALLSGLNAGVSASVGREALPALGALLWVSSVTLAAALWSLGWELGLRRAAPLLPLLLVANDLVLNRELTTDLHAFKAEIVGRAVAFCGAAVAVRAFRTLDRWRDAVISGGLLGAAGVIHAVPTFVAAVVVGWYAVARLALDRRPAALAARAAVVAAAVVAVGGAVLLASGGDAAVGGAASDDSAATFGPGFDPTLFLNQGIDVVPRPGPHPWYLSPVRVAERYTATALGIGGPPGAAAAVLTWVVALGGLAAAVAFLLRGPPAIRTVGVVAWGTAATIVAVSWILTFRVLFVPATFGLRRLFDYSSLPVALAVAAAVEAALDGLARRSVRAASVALVACVAVTAAALLPSARPAASPAGADRQLVTAFDWIRAHVPCDARILADQHTEGVFEALAGRVAVLEGATPYLRPGLLPDVVSRLLDARSFFEDPAAHPTFPEQLRASYVVVMKEGGVGYPLTERTDTEGLGELPSLRRVFTSSAMDVYAVGPISGAPSSGPLGSGPAPTFPCFVAPAQT